MMRWIVAAMLLAGTAHAEPSAAGLAHALDRLGTTGRVLYVAAHPDDENTRLLAYLANIRHLEVAYLAMTRGGGGQNLIGGEQGALLDVIRTEELLAARRIDGARQFFTRMRDFGYSKRADETLAKWGHDDALADVVWVIRTFQPDVIITRFTESPPNHGHHTASAILAREAFAAAGDPKRFPEQLRDGVAVWQADRLVNNFPLFGGATPPKTEVTLDVGAYDPRLGLGMGELAARSRSQHKSQGFGVPEQRGPIVEHFVPLAGTAPKGDLLEGLQLGWARYGAAATGYAKAIADAQRALDRDHPERALPALVRAHAELDKLRDDVRVREARRALAEVIAGAAGLFVRATAADPGAAPGATVDVSLELVTRGTPIAVRRIELPGAGPAAELRPGVGGAAATKGPSVAPPISLGAAEKRQLAFAVAIPATAAPSQPYWLIAPPQPGRYEVRDPHLIGAPRAPAALEAALDVAIAGRVVRLARPVVHAWVDPVAGERERPFAIVPPVTVTPLRDAVLAPGRAAPLDLRVRAGGDAVTATVQLKLPPGWSAAPASHAIKLVKAGDEVTVRFDVKPDARAAAGEATPVARIGDTAWSMREDAIDHPHIPVQVVLRPAAVRLVPLAIRLPAGRVAYVKGSGDSIAADLAHVGFAIDELDDDALRTVELGRYAAVIVGIRAYNARPAVRLAHPRLLAYAERGGTLIVQYNTLDLDGTPVGPPGLQLGRDRITDETAAPTFLDPADPLLQRPNKLEAADFDGWVQERGIYFASKWPAQAKPLLRFSDPGDGPLDGALVTQKLGKGRYIYTGLVLFRQLPAGVPGAYRLFANLIGGGK
jgi:LmbE family N-acetylglucosaminyl deacetylase